MSKLPNVFVNKNNCKVNNNVETFYSENEAILQTKEETKEILSEMMIRKKIRDFFSSPRYVYKIRCQITIDDKTKEEIIIAQSKDSLLTLDNRTILIKDIKNIKML